MHTPEAKKEPELALPTNSIQPPAQVPVKNILSNPEVQEPYEIFFKINSSQLDKNAIQIIKQAASDAKKFNPQKILINGNTDRLGTLQYNRELSANRANAVAKLLIKHGVAENLLDIRSYGASAAWVDQVPYDEDMRYRSVKIIFLKYNKMNYN